MKGFVSEERVVFIGGEANPFDKVLMLELSELLQWSFDQKLMFDIQSFYSRPTAKIYIKLKDLKSHI